MNPRKLYQIRNTKTGEIRVCGSTQLAKEFHVSLNHIYACARVGNLLGGIWEMESVSRNHAKPQCVIDFERQAKKRLQQKETQRTIHALYDAYTSGRNPKWDIKEIAYEFSVEEEDIKKVLGL